MAALSQLSYSPTHLVGGRVSYRDLLIVGRRRQPEVDDLPPCDVPRVDVELEDVPQRG